MCCPGGRRAGSKPASRTFFSALDRNTPTYTSPVASVATKAYVRPRAYVSRPRDRTRRISSSGSSPTTSWPERACEALILTPKGRVIAPLLVWRRSEDDFLLLTEPELGEARACPPRAHAHRRRAARSSSRSTPRRSCSAAGDGIPTRDYGVPAVEVLDAGVDGELPDEELERLRILACTPRWGREIDDEHPAGRGGARRAGGLVHQGLLPGPGAARPPPRARPRQPSAARARDRG